MIPESSPVVFSLVKESDPILHRRATYVFDFAPVRSIAEGMRSTALYLDLDFLTAPHCKIPLRIILAGQMRYCIVNPEIVGDIGLPDGKCLIRCPENNKPVEVMRNDFVTIQGYTAYGEPILQEFLGRDAVCVQIAMEYINGNPLRKRSWLDSFLHK